MGKNIKVKNLTMYHFHISNQYDDVWETGYVIDNTSEHFINDFSYQCAFDSSFYCGKSSVIEAVMDFVIDFLSEDTLDGMIRDKEFSFFHDYQLRNRELALEKVRQKYYPELLSRFNSIWLCDKEQLEYWKRIFKEGAKLYEVSVTGEIFETNEVLLPKMTANYNNMMKQAHDYWNAEYSIQDKETCEYLFKGKIKILKELK